MRKRGATLREIGQRFNISRERVRQILLRLAAREREKAEAESMPFTPDAPLRILQLSTRSSNCLRNENIRMVRDLLAYSEAELMRLLNFGRGSLEEVKRALARHGCRLADNPRPRPTAGLPTFSVSVDGRDVLRALAEAWGPDAHGLVQKPTEAEWRLKWRLASLLKQQALLAEDATPEGEAEYLRVVSEIARVQAEVSAQQQKAANGKGRHNGH
jgi:hypothetical protein